MWREIAGDEAATGTTFIVYNKRPGNEEWESLPIDFGGFTGYDRLNGTADVYGLHPSVVLYGNIPIAGVDYSVQTFNFNGASSWVKLDGANTTALANMTGVTFSGWELIGTKQDAWGYANIDVAEVIRYNRVLTSEEENAVGAYLETKYLLSTAYVTGPNGVNGVVVDEGSNPVPGAIVRVVDGTEAAKTDSAGAFTMAINPGTYTLRVTKSGYGTGELTNVVVQANTYTPVSLLLPAPPPPTGVSGIVSASNLPGNPPIVGARVRALGTSYQTYTGSNGGYTLELPTGTYEIEADKDHYGSSAAEFNAVEGTIQSLNFSMTHDGIWDLVTDYTTVCNPAGQWSFGYTETETGPLTPLATRINNAWSAGMNLWMDASADGWYGFIGRNDTGAPVTVDQYAAESCISYVEPGDMYFGGGGHPGNQVRIRWTAPDQRIVKINLRYFSQFNDQNNQGANLSLTVAKNGDAISVRSVSGFMGRADAGYTDRVGTAPENTFETMLIANSGDTIDFVVGQGGLYGDSYTWKWPHKSVAIWATVTTSTEGSVVGTVAQIKNAPVGTTVFLTTPVRLASSTGGDFACATSTCRTKTESMASGAMGMPPCRHMRKATRSRSRVWLSPMQ
jgi:hypothetical protein